jgi:hypothetical protein
MLGTTNRKEPVKYFAEWKKFAEAMFKRAEVESSTFFSHRDKTIEKFSHSVQCQKK